MRDALPRRALLLAVGTLLAFAPLWMGPLGVGQPQYRIHADPVSFDGAGTANYEVTGYPRGPTRGIDCMFETRVDRTCAVASALVDENVAGPVHATTDADPFVALPERRGFYMRVADEGEDNTTFRLVRVTEQRAIESVAVDLDTAPKPARRAIAADDDTVLVPRRLDPDPDPERHRTMFVEHEGHTWLVYEDGVETSTLDDDSGLLHSVAILLGLALVYFGARSER